MKKVFIKMLVGLVFLTVCVGLGIALTEGLELMGMDSDMKAGVAGLIVLGLLLSWTVGNAILKDH